MKRAIFWRKPPVHASLSTFRNGLERMQEQITSTRRFPLHGSSQRLTDRPSRCLTSHCNSTATDCLRKSRSQKTAQHCSKRPPQSALSVMANFIRLQEVQRMSVWTASRPVFQERRLPALLKRRRPAAACVLTPDAMSIMTVSWIAKSPYRSLGKPWTLL